MTTDERAFYLRASRLGMGQIQHPVERQQRVIPLMLRIPSAACLHGVAVNLLKPTGHVMHQQFNIQQLYVLPTLYLCVLYLSENKQRLVPLTA